MRKFTRLALGLIPVVGWAQVQAPRPNPQAQSPDATAPAADPVLASLLDEALERNPDLAKAKALVEAETQRVPQAKALPDPSLSLGLQNDGFKGIQVGKMETSFYQVMLTQPLPWPGKRSLRGEITSLGVEVSRAATERARLTITADVKRAYIGLLLVRGQVELLDQQNLFWQKASDITRVRYEVGQGSQADLLRAQLELNRLRQTRFSLRAQEQVFLATLNRLRAKPAETPVQTTARLKAFTPEPSPAAGWSALADKGSPELLAARLGIKQAERTLDLAKRDRFPDFAVSAGIMPRGSLDPMWQVGFSVSLPIWSGQKQKRAVSEQEIRRRAQGSEAESIHLLLDQRIQERADQFEATVETIRLYREGILVQGESTFQATLAQYEAGRAPFLSVLEALNGWIADEGALLQSLAQAAALQIAQEEFNLAGTPPITVQALGSAAMGMGGSPGGAAMPSPTPKSGPTSAPGGQGGSSMKSM